jgi:hypothetical protein
MDKTYRVTLKLSEPEAIALARLAQADLRDMRTQAHFYVRAKLVEAGILPALAAEPLPTLSPAVPLVSAAQTTATAQTA